MTPLSPRRPYYTPIGKALGYRCKPFYRYWFNNGMRFAIRWCFIVLIVAVSLSAMSPSLFALYQKSPWLPVAFAICPPAILSVLYVILRMPRDIERLPDEERRALNSQLSTICLASAACAIIAILLSMSFAPLGAFYAKNPEWFIAVALSVPTVIAGSYFWLKIPRTMPKRAEDPTSLKTELA